MATTYACLVLMPATALLASVNLVNLIQIGCLSVGFDTVKHDKYRC